MYGDPHVHPQTQTTIGKRKSIGTRSCYDEGKRCAETLFFDYYRQHGVQIEGRTNILNTYGPRMHYADGRVVSNFIVQALRNEPISIYGNRPQNRAFCFVDDLVDGLLRLMGTEFNCYGPSQSQQP